MIGILLLAGSVLGEEPHLKRNPVLHQVIERGAIAGGKEGGEANKLSPPTLPDGMSVDEQVAAIEELGGTRYPFDRLTRKSVVAPQIIRVPSAPESDSEVRLRTVDCWFVVHADLDAVSDPEFLGKLLDMQEDDGEAGGLTAEQLQARGITISKEHADQEVFGHFTHDLLDKVRIQATGHSFWSRTEESIVGAVVVDRRFAGDDEFPNQWSLIEESDSETETGSAKPYQGAGFYVKITNLQRPEGALFVEFHLVFSEPIEWFRGTNQLGAKLPIVLQSQVRAARREMMLATRAAAEGG